MKFNYQLRIKFVLSVNLRPARSHKLFSSRPNDRSDQDRPTYKGRKLGRYLSDQLLQNGFVRSTIALANVTNKSVEAASPSNRSICDARILLMAAKKESCIPFNCSSIAASFFINASYVPASGRLSIKAETFIPVFFAK